jgi:Asp-tRNA(Asn)/Glu-tRNA(Gln) amidotransferase A subunit family amidase
MSMRRLKHLRRRAFARLGPRSTTLRAGGWPGHGRTSGPVVALALAISLLAPRAARAQVEVTGATITELQDAMSAGRATSAGITRAYLDRIAAYDQRGPAINAMVWLNPQAVAQAEALDRERAERGPRGPLHGIPIILKDNYDTFDLPTTAGTLALAGFIPPDDAFQVARLREAGAVILGKANMEELASGITTISSMGGQTLNPYDLTRNPGGSSGGTGAAVAASFGAVGWGSDTCGSIRIPAAQNDLVGLRPTKGLSSIDGIIPLSHTQDVAGPLARSMRDLAIALDATVGPDPADPATALVEGREPPRFVDALDGDALAGARIGILEAYFGSAPEEAAAARIVRDAIARMVELGADTMTVEIADLSELIAGSGVINHEFKFDLIDYLAASPNAPVSSLQEMLDLGLIHQALVPRMRTRNQVEARDTDEYRAALAKRGPLRDAVEGALNRNSLDALVFPTVRTIPAVIGDPQRGSSCSLSANTGLPSLSVPAGFTDDGLPIGMEMIGRELDDARLVALGYAFEQATDHRREPTTTPPLVDGTAPGPYFIDLVPGAPEGMVVAGTGVTLVGRARLDAPRNELRVAVSVEGASSEEVHAIALRWPDGEGGWQVAQRLSGPGTAAASTLVRLSADQRRSLDRGEMHVIALTRSYPHGAAVASLGARN